MKIAQITYSGFGGLGSVVFSLIFADEGNNNDWIIGFLGNQKLDQDYNKLCNELDLSYASFLSKPKNPFTAWVKLYKWLISEKPDAIICHTLNPIIVCRIYAWIFNVPLIGVEHTSNFVKPRNEKITSFLSMIFADRIVVLTKQYFKELRNMHKIFFRSKKVVVIHNGIDLNLFKPSEEKKIQKEEFIIGMAARFTKTKKQDFLINVLEFIHKTDPSINLKLSLAGNGSEFTRVKNLAQNSFVSSQVIFEGLIEEKEVASWMNKLDIYVHATDGETLSTSILQSMGCGVPIIGSDVSGVNNLIKPDSDLGYCVKNEESIFANTILHLLQNPDELNRMGNNARSYAEEHYSNNTMLSKYIDLIRSIIS